MLTMADIRKAINKSGKPIEYWAAKAEISYWAVRRIVKDGSERMKIDSYHKLVKAIESEK
jgi:hypothetical protein